MPTPDASRWLTALPLAALCGCVSFAAPPPLVTLGGPQTASRHGSQVGLAVGSAASLFPGGHFGGLGYLGRFRFGLTDWLDLGADLLGYHRSSKLGLTGKLAGRARVHRFVAVELGIGAADDSDGKSVNFETGAVLGTDRHALWDFYAALRVAGALGVVQNPLDEKNPEVVGAQHVILGLASLGAAARIAPRTRFVFEGGYSLLFVHHVDDIGQGIYVGVGLVVNVGGKQEEPAPQHP